MSTQQDLKTKKRNLTFKDYVQKFNELETVFDSMPTGVFAILDQKLNIATINKTAGEILGSECQSIIGKNARQVFESNFPRNSKVD